MDGYYNFVPEGATGDDAKVIYVFFEDSDDVIEEAIAGNCVHIGDDGICTMGLIIRDNADHRWGVIHGHGFDKEFCPATPSTSPPECSGCTQNTCEAFCMKIEDDKLIPVSEGVTKIITCNPYVKDGKPESIDLGAFLVPPDDTNIHSYRLSVREILDVAKQETLTTLTPYGDALFTVLGDAHKGIRDIGSDIVPWKVAEGWMTERKNVFCFKKGMISGWTYGRLDKITTNKMHIGAIGNTTQPGDCGSIWFGKF
ncbi:hypothetical protein AA313_de0209338 [Arthrobotrys entomopaga]|nr:hypothetical protein AA313_de0209338 [Arthrobotrys entomopaga]